MAPIFLTVAVYMCFGSGFNQRVFFSKRLQRNAFDVSDISTLTINSPNSWILDLFSKVRVVIGWGVYGLDNQILQMILVLLRILLIDILRVVLCVFLLLNMVFAKVN